mgnify:CR=1 FL=1
MGGAAPLFSSLLSLTRPLSLPHPSLGMDLFGVKLPEASKLLGKKFACGSSVTKTAEGKEQVEVQGDVAARAAAVILASYGGGAGGLAEGQFFIVENKKRRPAFGGEEGG